MARRLQTKLTPEQFYALPNIDGRHELVRGSLVEEPPPGFQHGMLAARICSLLDSHVRQSGSPGVVVTCDTWFELVGLPATVRGPDVAYITLARYRALADVRKAAPGAPDLAVEVRSPSQSIEAMRAKADDYLAAGGSEVWVVDPAIAIVEVWRRGKAPRGLSGRDVLSTPDLLPGFAPVIAELFAPPGALP